MSRRRTQTHPSLRARERDGNIYSFGLSDALVGVSVVPRVENNKELRKRNPGIPLPKDEGQKLDEEIKKEEEERLEKEVGGTTPESESLLRRANLDEKTGASKTPEQLEKEQQQEQSVKFANALSSHTRMSVRNPAISFK